MTEKEFAQLMSHVTDPASFLAITALVGGSAIGREDHKQAKLLAADFQKYRPFAQAALNLITGSSVAAEEEARELFRDAETFLQTYFLNALTPAQRAGRTIHERAERKKEEYRQQYRDRETARSLARQTLHNKNASPADRLAAAQKLEELN